MPTSLVRPCGIGQFAADHQLAELATVDVVGLHLGHGGAGADDGDVVGDREHFVELVGDEDDGGAFGDELAEVDEQLVDLLGNEHGGGLVEDQDPGAPVEHLQDLDSLALTDAEIVDRGVEIDLGADRLPVRRARRLASSNFDDAVLGGLGAEDDVLEHGEVVGEHEVLVHHADAGGDGIARRLEVDVAARTRRSFRSSGWCMPYSVFISVDLPAPFSPTIAWMVPARTRRLTSWLAMTPGKRLLDPTSSTANVVPCPPIHRWL